MRHRLSGRCTPKTLVPRGTRPTSLAREAAAARTAVGVSETAPTETQQDNRLAAAVESLKAQLEEISAMIAKSKVASCDED